MLRDDVPWGRRPVPGIPVPPFDDVEQCRTFLHALAEHLACLARVAARVDPATFALQSALGDVDHALRYGRAGEPVLPSWVMRVAVTTYFPAPWTVPQLVAVIDEHGLMDGVRWSADAHRVGYGGDPEFTAERDRGGRWVATFRERGESRVDAEVDGDDDMVLYLMAHVRGHPYPFGWRLQDEQRVAELADRAGPIAAAWDWHAQLPYLRVWADG